MKQPIPYQTKLDLSVIIVSWNVKHLLPSCIDSLVQSVSLANISYEIIIIDNMSTDGTPAFLKENYPDVILIEPGENTGFAKGNNIGIKESRGDFVYLLNPDTITIGDATTRLLNFLQEHPGAGVVGPRLLNEDRSIQPSRRRFPTKWTGIFESTWLQKVAPRKILDLYFMIDIPEPTPHQVDWLQGSALVVRKRAISDAGLLDEAFFMYSEEIDWQYRINQAGWTIHYCPNAEVIHLGGKSSEQVATLQHIYFQSSKIHYFRKYHGDRFARFLKCYLLCSYRLQWGIEGFKWLLGHNRSLRQQRMNAYSEVIASGLRGTET